MRNARILVVDDDPRILRLLQLNLEAEGYQVLTAASGKAGYDALLTGQPDVIFLDLILPDMDGMLLCQRVREFSDIPIIILTARKDEKYLVQGLDVGADDYIEKPFRRDALLARLRAVLRRAGFAASDECSADQVVCGPFHLSCRDRRLTITVPGGPAGGRVVKLSHTEFKLLYLLMTNPNHLLSNEELVTRVWGPEFAGDTESLRTYIRYLRQKIEPDPKTPLYLLTERGIGYRFVHKS